MDKDFQLNNLLNELKNQWIRVSKEYKGNDSINFLDWGKWSHGFNKNIRQNIAFLKEKLKDKNDVEEIRCAIEVFVLLFQIWQCQYKMFVMKEKTFIDKEILIKENLKYKNLLTMVENQIKRYCDIRNRKY